jgi:hypothetical protein
MLRVTKLIITLPLLTLPLCALAPTAEAEDVTQLDALRLLAQSQATHGKCTILSAGDADELNSYLARAEIAAANRHSVSEVRSTISLGKTLGKTASCSDRTTAEVGAVLSAARQAMAAAARPQQGVDEDTAEIRNENPVTRPRERKPERQRRLTLAAYGRQAFAYYVERRCGYLSRRDIRAFWTEIVREHKAALSAFGGAAVARTLHRARAEAGGMSCAAADSRQLVRSAYVNLARN